MENLTVIGETGNIHLKIRPSSLNNPFLDIIDHRAGKQVIIHLNTKEKVKSVVDNLLQYVPGEYFTRGQVEEALEPLETWMADGENSLRNREFSEVYSNAPIFRDLTAVASHALREVKRLTERVPQTNPKLLEVQKRIEDAQKELEKAQAELNELRKEERD